MEKFEHLLHEINGYLWGWPTIVLLIVTGVYLTLVLRGIQFTKLFPALKMAFSSEGRKSKGDGSISNFQALMTALAGTVGTGNVAGVATAIAIGGPGALFWMWVTGILGMATKYSEALLGVHYRQKRANGNTYGGPMYYMTQGLNMKWLAIIYASMLVIAAVGAGGMVQSNSVADAMDTAYGINPLITGIALTILTGAVIMGGIKRIGQVTEALVPTMIILYISVGTAIIVLNLEAIPGIFAMIFHDAFYGTAMVGGFAGAGIQQAMRMGFARGIFSNESGLGSAAMPAAAARTRHPSEQALISMTQTFIDTLVVCTFTGVIILLSGLWNVERHGSNGAALTSDAFSSTLGINIYGIDLGSAVVAVALFFFVFSTLIGWSYYGQKCAEFIFGNRVKNLFNLAFLCSIFMGGYILTLGENSKIGVNIVWGMAEATAALIIFPNLIALILLSPKVRELTKDYLATISGKQKEFKVKPFAND